MPHFAVSKPGKILSLGTRDHVQAAKAILWLKSFMIRSAKAIDRFLIILTLAWFWFTRQTGVVLPFSVSIRRYRGSLSIF